MIVFLSAAGLIYHSLLPSGKISRTAQTVLSLMTVMCVMLPLFRIIFRDEDEAFLQLFTDCVQSSLYEPYSEYAQIAEKTVKEKLSVIIGRYTVETYTIETDINISDEGCIDIKQVLIVFEKYPEKIEELSAEIEEALGIVPVFYMKENDDD